MANYRYVISDIFSNEDFLVTIEHRQTITSFMSYLEVNDMFSVHNPLLFGWPYYISHTASVVAHWTMFVLLVLSTHFAKFFNLSGVKVYTVLPFSCDLPFFINLSDSLQCLSFAMFLRSF